MRKRQPCSKMRGLALFIDPHNRPAATTLKKLCSTASAAVPLTILYLECMLALTTPKRLQKGLVAKFPALGSMQISKYRQLSLTQGGGMNYEQTWPIVVSAFENDWWDAAQIYRTWALASADWTKQGTMAQRMDKIPSWAFDLTTWINTHWQQNDIFNITGGTQRWYIIE